MAKPKKDSPADAKPKKQTKPSKKPSAVAPEPVFTAEPVDPLGVDARAAAAAAGRSPRGLLDRLSGARMCYGEPISGGDVTVVPVSRVRVAGGFGDGEGGTGGGGAVDATPVGYIEVGPDGARYLPIEDPDRMLRVARSLAVTTAAALGAFAALRSLTR